jgi:hypothetical protein
MSEATSGAPAGLIDDDPAFRFAHAGYLIVNAVPSIVAMKTGQERGIPCSDEKFPVPSKKFPVHAEKFPVPGASGNLPATP